MAKVYVTDDGRQLKSDPRKAPRARTGVKQAQKNKLSDTQVRKQTFIKYVKNGKSIKEACQDMAK